MVVLGRHSQPIRPQSSLFSISPLDQSEPREVKSVIVDSSVAPVQALDVTGCHEESELEQEEQNIVSRQQGRKQNNSYNPAPAPAPALRVTSNLVITIRQG